MESEKKGFKKYLTKWEIVGLIASAGSVVAWIPQLIDLIKVPSKAQDASISLYAIAAGANILWVVYAIGIKSLSVGLCSALIVVFTLISMIYVLIIRAKYKSSSSASS